MRDSGASSVTDALFTKLPILFPLREDPSCGEEADVRKRTELFVGYVGCNSRQLYLRGFTGQLSQGLCKPGLHTLGHDIGVALHIPTKVVQRQSNTNLRQLRVCVCQYGIVR